MLFSIDVEDFANIFKNNENAKFYRKNRQIFLN